jgi:two-component system cell cycle response regulator
MKARILVIEDNAANMELMTDLLQAFSHVTLKARDGKEGLEAARREQPDLIICDLQLPLMSGYQIAQALKADAALRSVPLLAVTAFAMVDDRTKALAAGFDGYFSKPIEPETFVQQVQRFLPQRHALARTVLVTDDEPVNLQLASSLLAGSGYKVVTAPNPVEALRLAREVVPDLILSDVCMTDGSGYDFLEAVKADPRLRSIPFIFLTSTMTSEGERRKGLALGATRYFFRPMDSEDLLREIEACLGEAAAS